MPRKFSLGLWCAYEEKKGLELLEPLSTLGAPVQLWEQVLTCPPDHSGIPLLPRVQGPSWGKGQTDFAQRA